MKLSATPKFKLIIDLLTKYQTYLNNEKEYMPLTISRFLHDSSIFEIMDYNNFKIALYEILTNVNVTVTTSQLSLLLPNVQPHNDFDNPDVTFDSIFKYTINDDIITLNHEFTKDDLTLLINQIKKLDTSNN